VLSGAEEMVSVATEYYWSYEERDGGLYMQIESVSLTRAVPRGWDGWWGVCGVCSAESLEFTLRAVREALRKQVL